jgi:hypothetical protein
VTTRCPRFRRQSTPHRRASTRPDRVKLRWHSEFQDIIVPRVAEKREYHSSRLKETETALAKARNRSGREVPNTGWIFAGCLRSQASSMVSAVVSWRWAYFCTKRAVSFRSFSQCLCLDLLILKRADQRWRRISHNSARRISSPVKSG